MITFGREWLTLIRTFVWLGLRRTVGVKATFVAYAFLAAFLTLGLAVFGFAAFTFLGLLAGFCAGLATLIVGCLGCLCCWFLVFLWALGRLLWWFLECLGFLDLLWCHRRIQDFVRGGPMPSWHPGGGKALLAPLDPRLTIWGSNFLWGGGAKAPLPPPLDPRLGVLGFLALGLVTLVGFSTLPNLKEPAAPVPFVWTSLPATTADLR